VEMMPIKIFHTADLHLGMKFTRGYAPDVQENLVEARFETLRSMIETANRQDCDLFVVAGDLFNNQRIPKKDVLRAADLLKGFDGRFVLVLPGNHDYIQKGEDQLWSRFHESMSEHTLFLDAPRCTDLTPHGLDMIVYAAPCTAKHSSTNAIGWIRECPKEPDTSFHCGIAHGSLEGLSPDFNKDYYPMSREELSTAGLDLWLMGHTHIRYPDEDVGTEAKIFFPSTPEPDGFDCKHPGYAWLIELGEDKSVRYQSIQTGRYRFFTMERELSAEDDVEVLKSYFHKLDREKHLVKLKLKGRVQGEIYDERSAMLTELNECVLHLEANLSELFREITVEDINREFTEGSFPYKLLMALAKDQQNPISLQIAYDFIQKVRS